MTVTEWLLQCLWNNKIHVIISKFNFIFDFGIDFIIPVYKHIEIRKNRTVEMTMRTIMFALMDQNQHNHYCNMYLRKIFCFTNLLYIHFSIKFRKLLISLIFFFVTTQSKWKSKAIKELNAYFSFWIELFTAFDRCWSRIDSAFEHQIYNFLLEQLHKFWHVTRQTQTTFP